MVTVAKGMRRLEFHVAGIFILNKLQIAVAPFSPRPSAYGSRLRFFITLVLLCFRVVCSR